MPGAHKKEHHAFQLTLSYLEPTHIRLTHLLPTTPAHCILNYVLAQLQDSCLTRHAA